MDAVTDEVDGCSSDRLAHEIASVEQRPQHLHLRLCELQRLLEIPLISTESVHESRNLCKRVKEVNGDLRWRAETHQLGAQASREHHCLAPRREHVQCLTQKS